MFPQRLRLSFTESQLVRQKGSRTQSVEMELIYSPKPEQGHCRWLIQIPRRLTPKASQRNHHKRLISESIRTFSPLMKVSGDGIVKVKIGFHPRTLSEVKINIERLFQKAGVLRTNP